MTYPLIKGITTQLKTIEEIKEAVDSGKTVYADTTGYTVIKDKIGQYLITFDNGRTGYYIGLHGRKGTKYENKLNGEVFFTI